MTAPLLTLDDPIRAVLVTLECSAWRGQRVMPEVGTEVERQHRSQQGSTTVTKSLVPKKHLRPILSAQTSARYTFDQYTLPWDDNGTRLLPVKRVMAFRDAMQRVSRAHTDAVVSFVKAYPQILEESKVWLGDLYRAGEYPTPNQVEQQFQLRVIVMPLPDPQQFSQLGKWVATDVVAEVTANATDLVTARLQTAQQAVYRRLLERVTKLLVGLTERERFRAELLGGMLDLTDYASTELSLVPDPQLTAICSSLQGHFAFISPDALRSDPAIHAEAVRRLITAKAQLEGMLP